VLDGRATVERHVKRLRLPEVDVEDGLEQVGAHAGGARERVRESVDVDGLAEDGDVRGLLLWQLGLRAELLAEHLASGLGEPPEARLAAVVI